MTTHRHAGPSQPAPFLADSLELLPRGRALDVAMGNGRNAICLAGAGFAVEGVDASAGAVAEAKEAARQAGVTIKAEVADLENGYRIEKGAYDVIICFNYLHRPLIPQMKEGLRPGGMVVYETFTVDQAQFGHPRNPAYLLRYNELLDMFRELRCLRYREGIIGGKAIASIVAQRMPEGR